MFCGTNGICGEKMSTRVQESYLLLADHGRNPVVSFVFNPTRSRFETITFLPDFKIITGVKLQSIKALK